MRLSLIDCSFYYRGKLHQEAGGCACLFRHTPASLMVQNGCDLLTIQQVMRHNDITTIMRYLHLADDTKRYKYDKFMKLEGKLNLNIFTTSVEILSDVDYR
jgi:integrase